MKNNIDLFTISKEQKKRTIKLLIDSSSPTKAFFLILIVSSIITTFGIVLDNVAIVIGGMLVSPLLSPILAISIGIVLVDYNLIWRSIRVLLYSAAYVIVISFIFSFFVINKELNSEIISRTYPNLIYFGVALASGVAAAFAFAKEEFSERIVGVAVAIALLPPLSVIGIGLAYWNMHVLSGSLALFLTNLLGILLGSLIVFSLFCMYPEKKIAQAELKEEEEELKNIKK